MSTIPRLVGNHGHRRPTRVSRTLLRIAVTGVLLFGMMR